MDGRLKNQSQSAGSGLAIVPSLTTKSRSTTPIKNKASELEELYGKVKTGRYNALAITSLEQSVMWIVKELTA